MASQSYSFDSIKVDVEPDGVTWLRFNTPEKRNAITPTLSKDMNACLDRMAEDDDVRVVILTGEGTAFCAGMDLKVFYQFRNRPQEEWAPPGEGPMEWFEKFRVLPKVTIAAVNGYAFGGGVIPIGYADVGIASDRAVIGLSEINWGSPPGGGATRSPMENVPLRWIKWLVLSGETIDGEMAARIGLVNWVVPHEKLLEEAARIARIFLPHHPTALAFAKKQILGSMEITDHLKAVDWEFTVINQMGELGYAGSHEGWKAFADKDYRPGLQALDFRDRSVEGHE